jgi:hypothetical protein
MAKQTTVLVKIDKNISRPNIHSKCKTSKLKSSKNYKKLYKGQGR